MSVIEALLPWIVWHDVTHPSAAAGMITGFTEYAIQPWNFSA